MKRGWHMSVFMVYLLMQWQIDPVISKMGPVSFCTSSEFVMRTVSTTSAHVLPMELRLWLFVSVAIRQILMMGGLERLMMEKSRLMSLGIWVVGFHLSCMRMMLVLIMVLILLD